MQHEHRRCPGHDCACEVGRVRGFVEPCAVLLISERESHGYDLLTRLAEFGIDPESIDPGTLYRTLRRLERDGILRSEWSTEGVGPARRIYQITPEGLDFLRAWRQSVIGIRASLDGFLTACEGVLGEDIQVDKQV